MLAATLEGDVCTTAGLPVAVWVATFPGCALLPANTGAESTNTPTRTDKVANNINLLNMFRLLV